MSNTLLKTFRLPLDVAREIEQEAEAKNISQAQYLVSIVIENRSHKMKDKFQADLEKMALDEAYLKEQKDLAEADFE